jgi:hypothetical protein
MACCSRGSLLDNEVMQELHRDLLSDAPSDCESHKSSNGNDDDDYDFGSSKSQKNKKKKEGKLEVSDSDVNTDDDDDDDDDNDCWSNNDDLRNLEQF